MPKRSTKAVRDLAAIFVVAAVTLFVAFCHDASDNFERWQIDELVVVPVVFGLAFGFYSWRRWRELKEEVLEREKVETQLRQSEERYRALVQHASDIVLVMEADGSVRYISPAVETVLGHKPEVVISKGAFDIVHPDDMPRVQDFVAKAVRNPGVTPRIELRLRHADGSWRHIESACTSLLDDPVVGGIVINSRDITEKKTIEEQLKHQAFYDNLTGLPNRTLFLERLRHALALSDRRGGEFAVLFVDIDDFKTVNDSLGHEVGDQLLVEVAKRLASCVRSGDTVARLFGDEFAVLLEAVAEGSSATKVAERMIEKLRQEPFVIQEREVFIAPSVGIAFGTPGEEQPEELLRRAGVAVYEAKKRGGPAHARVPDPENRPEAGPQGRGV